MTNGWDESAAAWIADMDAASEFSRRYVLDPVMRERALASGAKSALDVGCGEGRFCRMLNDMGIAATGLDPTKALLAEARRRDATGAYVEGVAEAPPFPDAAFGLVVSYLTLIDIPGLEPAIAEMSRVLKPGGRLLIANLTNFITAGVETGWSRNDKGERLAYQIDRYLEVRSAWIEWRGIRILNYHRPLSAYMRLALEHGLRLSYFDEPRPTADAPPDRVRDYTRMPWFFVMEWTRD